MNRPGLALLAITTLIAACWTSSVLADEPSGDPMKHNDGTPDGRLVVGDSGETVHFTLSKDGEKIAGVRIHGSRYGADASKEKVVIYFLNSDLTEILGAQLAPYSVFETRAEKWVDIKFPHPVTVPKDFWVLLDSHNSDPRTNPNAHGVFVSYDKSTGGKFSKMGLPWLEFRDVPFPGDWMFELIPAK